MALPNERLPRRMFLAGLAAAAPLGALLALGSRRRPVGPAPSVGERTFRVESATAADFAPHLGSSFRIRPEGGAPILVELAEVDDRPAALRGVAAPAGRDPFSIVFRGPSTASPVSELVTIEHERLGTFPLFVVSVGRGAKAAWYQAIFG